MSYFRFAACASLLVLAGCGAKPGVATETDTASLIRGSWTCNFAGKDITTGEELTGTYSVSYVSDGTWASSGAWKSKFEGKSIELGLVGRGSWAVVDGKLEEKSNYGAATWAKVGGETLDHGEYNRAMAIFFRENPSLDPTKVTGVVTLSGLTAESMVGVDLNGGNLICERLKT